MSMDALALLLGAASLALLLGWALTRGAVRRREREKLRASFEREERK